MWFEWLILCVILAGTFTVGWVLYSGKCGPTHCVGCGKCAADGQCILQKRGKKDKRGGIPR